MGNKAKDKREGGLRYGEMARIAKELGVSRGHVSRVLTGERQSRRVERAVALAMTRIKSKANQERP